MNVVMGSNPHKHTTISEEGQTLLVKLSGKHIGKESLNMSESSKLDIINAFGNAKNTINNIVFDLSDLEAVSSTGLLPFLKANQLLKETKATGKVILINPQERVSTVLKITWLDVVFDIKEETIENILETLQNKAE